MRSDPLVLTIATRLLVAKRDQRIDACRAAAGIRVVGRREALSIDAGGWHRLEQHHDPLRLREGERSQEHGVDQAAHAVFAPMPRLSVSTTISVKPGCLTSIRAP